MIERDPFPHLWLDAGLPADLYTAAAQAWPSQAEMLLSLQHKRAKTTAKPTMRTLGMAIEPEFVKYDGFPIGPAWDAVYTYCAETLTPRLLDLFADAVRTHIREVAAETQWTTATVESLQANHGRLMVRWPGYRLRPHVDVAPYAITVLHYFPDAGDVEDGSGTRLYRAEREMPIEALAQPFTQYFDDYAIPAPHVTTLPWRANGCLAFPNTRRSAHGNFVKQGPRRVLQWHVALPGAEAKKNFRTMR